jgi:hypothetical protein
VRPDPTKALTELELTDHAVSLIVSAWSYGRPAKVYDAIERLDKLPGGAVKAF